MVKIDKRIVIFELILNILSPYLILAHYAGILKTRF